MKRVLDLIPDAVRSLWDEAVEFIADVLAQFDRESLRAGIRRSSGVRLSVWLNDAEVALRRIILMAALALAPLQPAPMQPAPRARHAATPRASAARPPSFRVFKLFGSGAPTGRRPLHLADRAQQPYGHIRFPADPFLALGRAPSRRATHRHNGGPILPRLARRNPLDRWGRLSRDDPDWRPPPETEFVEKPVIEPERDDMERLYGIALDDEPRRKRERSQPVRRDSRPDWRRCYDEWEKLVPAPHLAARLEALERAAANSAALVQRTARRLHAQREHVRMLARAAYPKTDLPRRARLVEITFLPDLGPSVHDRFDSS